MTIPPAVGWTVLALVFLDELLLVAALAVWGVDASGVWLALVAAGAAILVWSLFASPKAAYGGPVTRPAAKVLVVAAAVLGLVVAGHAGWAVALLVLSIVVNAVALRPDVRALTDPAG